MFKAYFIGLLLVIGFASCSTLSKTTKTPAAISETEAAQGIKDALEQGVSRAVSTLNKPNAFSNNPTYKLLLPPDAQKLDSILRKLGMGSLVDRAVTQINLAAEDAVGYARPVFSNAIKQMTISDAINIVKGPNNAATQYLRQKTTDQLIAAFLPIIKSSLEKFSATKYYSDMINTYNNFPTTLQKINADLPDYVTAKTVDALFDQISKEEANIRTNSHARTTDEMKKVFAWGSINR